MIFAWSFCRISKILRFTEVKSKWICEMPFRQVKTEREKILTRPQNSTCKKKTADQFQIRDKFGKETKTEEINEQIREECVCVWTVSNRFCHDYFFSFPIMQKKEIQSIKVIVEVEI